MAVNGILEVLNFQCLLKFHAQLGSWCIMLVLKNVTA